MLDSSFWDDSDRANELTSELKGIKSVICSINDLDDHISSNIDLLNVVSEDEDELSLLIFDEYKELKRLIADSSNHPVMPDTNKKYSDKKHSDKKYPDRKAK